MKLSAPKDRLARHPSGKPAAGFALLVTIVLVAFLVLILVGLATFSRVETSVAGNSQSISVARQNALSAMNVALGNLQRFAGPDKISTARADVTAVAAPTQPYFTGTWDNAGTLTSWLVSGNENAPTTGVTPATALNPSGGTYPVDDSAAEVFLVGNNSVNNNADRIRLAKQTITAPAGSVPGISTAQPVGHYAWWVGDEGVKASATLIDPLLAAGSISYNNPPDDWSDAVKKERLDQVQLPRPRLEKVLTSVDPDATANLTALPLVGARPQLRFLTGTPAAPTAAQVNGAFHDLTPLSRGVLADTAAGVLRTDLSSSVVTAGPITSYQALRPANVPATTPAGVEAEFYPIAPNSTAGTWPTYGLYPVISEGAIRLYFSVSGTGPGSTVQLNYLLDAELWNPYAARLLTDATRTLRFSVTFPNAVSFQLNDSSVPTSQVVTIAAGTTYSANIVNSVVWQPGQIVRVRGGAAMDVISAPTSSSANGVSMGAATVTTVNTVDAQSTVSNLGFKLEVVNTVTSVPNDLQTLTLAGPFSAQNGISNSPPSPALAYGYEFNRDFRVWTDGTQSGALDPRLPIMTSASQGFAESASSAWSLSDIGLNASNGFSGVLFNDSACVVLFDLPRQEITSVAQLRHMIGAKAYELGSSWGGTVNNRFDSTFVSTVPRSYTCSVTGSEPRPNRYLDIYVPDGVAAATLLDLRSASDSARYQLIRGAFNINSTSISAWKAVLGAKLTGWDHSGSAASGVNLDNAFFRVEHGAQQRPVLKASIPPVPNTTDLAALNDGELLGATGRQLEAADVTNLATEIVRLLKVRGKPFACLADFVNAGLIQTAIDNIGLNNAIGNVNLRHAAPGLTQSDVISCISPFMAARSDTFIIRAYGDVQNPATGSIEGRAWCEALVQRTPDLVSDSAATNATVINPPAVSNPFGRRFKIISFRWLSTDDL